MTSTIKLSLRADVLNGGYFDGLTTTMRIRTTGSSINMALSEEANKRYIPYLGILVREFQGIESRLNLVVANTLCLTSESDRRYFVLSTVVPSTMLTLDAKKKILLAWATAKKIFSSKSKDKFEKLLADLVTHRNAIVHGEPVVNADTGEIFLEYFRGDKKSQLFDEAFIRKVLKNLADTRQMIDLYAKAEETARLSVVGAPTAPKLALRAGGISSNSDQQPA